MSEALEVDALPLGNEVLREKARGVLLTATLKAAPYCLDVLTNSSVQRLAMKGS